MGLVFLSAACVSVAASYKEKAFDPGAFTGRDRKENQILFPGQDVSLGQDEQQSDSELWQQNEDAEENKKPEDKPSSSVLFQTMKVADNTANSETVPQEEQSQPQNDVIYQQGGSDDPKTPSSYKKPDGNADSDKPHAEPSKRPSDNGGGSDNKPGDNGGGKDNKPGDSNEPSPDTPDTPVTPSPAPSGEPARPDDNTGGNKSDTEDKKDTDKPDEPEEPSRKDPDPTVPTLPGNDYVYKDVDEYPGSDKIDIKDEEDYKRYSLKVIGILDSEDAINSLYMGEYLNDQRVLCSVLVYVCEDGKPKYRLMELDDNFKLGSYPEQITEDVVPLTFYFRPDEKHDWITCEYEAGIIYSAKLLLMDQENKEIYKQVLVPKNNTTVAMLEYYYGEAGNGLAGFGDEADTVGKPFRGWSETENGESVGNFYDVTKTGAQTLYALPETELPEGAEAEWQYVFLNHHDASYYTRVQVLTKAEPEDGVLTIPDGIQVADLPADVDWDTWEIIYTTCDTMKLPASLLYLSTTDTTENQEDTFNFRVNKAYEVAEDNINYAAEDGILMNQEKTQILSIPLEREKVIVPEGVTNVHFSMDNQIKEIHFTDEKPANASFASLYDAKIYVPTSSYLRYLSAWGKNPGGTSQLLAEGASVEEFTEDDTAIYSADGKTLLAVKSGVNGVYIVKEGVEKIAESAFENCGTINLLLLPESLKELESKSLLTNAPEKILFLGMTPPLVQDDSFADTSILQVETASKEAYEKAFAKAASAEQMINRVFSYNETEDGYQYLEEEEDETYPASALLLAAPSDITSFTEDSIPGISLTEIAPCVFADHTSLRLVELPAGLTKIGKEAFAGCSSLEGVLSYEPDQLEICENAFANTDAMRFAAFDALYLDSYFYYGSAHWYGNCNGTGTIYSIDRFSPYYYLEDAEVGQLLFGQATDEYNNATDENYLLGATSDVQGTITLSDKTTEIAGYVFNGCANPFTVEGLDHVIAVGDYAFNASGIQGEITLGSRLVYLGSFAFHSCNGLTGVTLDGSMLSRKVYEMPFGSSTFSYCSNLTYVNIVGEGFYDIGNEAFYGCMSLQDVSIAESAGIHRVGYAAFAGTGITTLELPASVDDIGYGVVSQCWQFEKMILHSTQPPILSAYDPHWAFEFADTVEENYIKVPEGAEQDYIDLWKYYLIGYTPEEADELTGEELLESENRARRILGISLEEEEDPSVSGNDIDADAVAVTVSGNAAE